MSEFGERSAHTAMVNVAMGHKAAYLQRRELKRSGLGIGHIDTNQTLTDRFSGVILKR